MIRFLFLLFLSFSLIHFPTNPLRAEGKPSLDLTKTAVLIMDYQNAIVGGGYVKNPDAFLGKAAQILSLARKTGVPVIYIVVGFRPGFPEVSPNNIMFGVIKKNGGLGKDPKALDIHPSVSPQADDIVVTKHRVGAFLGTDLDMILRARGIDTIVMMGVATSGVVLSTLRYASDADYRNVVIKDLCSDRDPQVHQILTEKIFPRQADVITSDDFIEILVGVPK
ncbi:cysteine hydrolase [Leptospira langatensis]|uniref:Cysteine hydrolase n=1 Tax=Leptospira langatensis TaxID=2484983 RepID=A0A5F1ZQH1_9LEPT|nr:isochorismatase family cysteine hydrolase [Leptospira langatensis]TGK05220.1 cysteine hydrolase [Leptospira langatensis]TGL38356.1 cysteine hydrolase [Leptospira langatensis]